MKKWEMPQVRIDQFASNEYVATCTHEENIWTLGCDFVEDSSSDFNPQHQSSAEVGGVCPNYSITISDYQLKKITGNRKFAGSDGEYISDREPRNNVGDQLYEVWKSTHNNHTFILFTVYNWVPGTSNTSGHYSLDTNQQNHRLGYGPKGNPQS